MTNQIHSFRSGEIYQNTGTSRVDLDGCCAFVYDICGGLPSEYGRCDLLYSEPSWLAGYSIFQERAGKSTLGPFKAYIEALACIVVSSKTPVILLCGKQTLKKLPKHQSELKLKLNGFWEVAFAWGIDISGVSAKTNEDLLYHLAKGPYNTIGDFSCGYGIAGRIFKSQGKRFVMSDINEKCITYIAENILHG